jgi:ketosteroid isomerase-like protein
VPAEKPVTAAETVSAEETGELIRSAEDRRYAAMVAADVDTLAGLLSDAVVYTHSSGSRDDKQTLLSKISDGSLVYVEVKHPVTQVIVLGEAVLVIGEMHADIVVGGQPRRLDNATLAVWAAQDGGWRLAAFQPTPLPG